MQMIIFIPETTSQRVVLNIEAHLGAITSKVLTMF
jgi:hypothetical protein